MNNFSFLLVGFYIGGLKSLRPSTRKNKQNESSGRSKTARWFKCVEVNLLREEEKALLPTRSVYYNSSPMKICSFDYKLIFMSGGAKVVPSFYRGDFTYTEFLTICSVKSINFVISDRKSLNMFPVLGGVATDTVNFKLIKEFKSGKYWQTVYGYVSKLDKKKLKALTVGTKDNNSE